MKVCGALAPLQGSTVELLHFQRQDRFREIVQENAELAACREALLKAGFDTDLGLYGLGPGKLLVRAELAQRVVEALRRRCAAKRRFLTSRDIAVSAEFKATVRSEQ